MGVWIETMTFVRLMGLTSSSHPIWVCGLKLFLSWHIRTKICRHTLYGCVDWNDYFVMGRLWGCCHTLYGCVDWNISLFYRQFHGRTSHPIWVCGLKHNLELGRVFRILSHPIWVCGLKPRYPCCGPTSYVVTPYMGVWIETCKDGSVHEMTVRSHPIWVCGLKLVCVRVQAKGCYVTPYMGVWIETIFETFFGNGFNCHTLYGCVDWNSLTVALSTANIVTPYMGVWIETVAVNLVSTPMAVTPYMGVWIETRCKQ